MTSFLRHFAGPIAAVSLPALALLSANGAQAAAPAPAATLTPATATAPTGGDGVFIVHANAAADAYPGLSYTATGGDVVGAVSLNDDGSGGLEGAVHVHRDSPGLVHLTASFAGQPLASADLSFVSTGSISVSVATGFAADAAARTWLVEVVDTSGNVASRLHVDTSGDRPTGTAETARLPYGYYTVRLVLGRDTALSCGNGALYQVLAPVGAETTVDLDAASVGVDAAIQLCDGAASATHVDMPIDPLVPAAAGATETNNPAEPPVNEVRGARQEGSGSVLPPATGSGGNEKSPVDPAPLFFAAFGTALLAIAPLAWLVARRARRSNR
jgi:hypothetical protein